MARTTAKQPAKEIAKQPTAGLVISDTLTLPVEAVVETFAIIARRGRGKTTTAVVMAEEMIGAGLPVLIIDPLGVWWGLRAAADGSGEGLPVVIFGGDHADIALNEKAGVPIADAVVEGRFPALLDLSHLSKSAMRRFMTDFIERLYHRNREALHVIVDEADMFAPQRTAPEGARLLGAMEDLQRRGRARGLGTTLITQRPAVLHKDLLSQAEVLIALGLTGPRDVAAIDEWVRLHADDDTAREVKGSLASLPVGTAWVWSPSWLDILEKVAIRPRRTFDSSATPKPGVARPTATAFAPVDKEALGQRIADLEAASAAEDPKALRARVATLERQLATATAAQTPAQTPAPVPARVERVEVPVLTDEHVARLEKMASDIAASTEQALQQATRQAEQAAQMLSEALGQARTHGQDLSAILAEPVALIRATYAQPTHQPTRRSAVSKSTSARPPASTSPAVSGVCPASPTSGETRKLGKAERRILIALAQHPGRTARQVALLTSYSHKSGGFRNALSHLRSAGLITGTGTAGMTATESGLAALGSYEPLPTGDALLAWWKAEHLHKAERAIVDVLRQDYPDAVATEEIAERTGYSAASGGFRNALSRLRSFEIAAGRGELLLADEFVDP